MKLRKMSIIALAVGVFAVGAASAQQPAPVPIRWTLSLTKCPSTCRLEHQLGLKGHSRWFRRDSQKPKSVVGR